MINMNQLIFATQNPGKIREMSQLLADLNIQVMSAQEAGVSEDVVEDGETFEENALKKARFVAEQTGEWAVADDSGIMIDVLDGRPGVYTARWAGDGASDEQLVSHTLDQLKDVEEGHRGASFHCVVALVSPENQEWTFEGVVEGKIVSEPRGTNRPKLPYDLIFCPIPLRPTSSSFRRRSESYGGQVEGQVGHNVTFAQMTDGQKNALSHRGRAFQKLKEFLKSL
jgi:XTP/dITP diphosphohydrolase